MNICYVVSDGLTEFNSSNFRCAVPSDALQRAGHKVNIIHVRQWMEQSEFCRKVCADADIIHLQRVLITETHNMIRYWRSLGKAVTCDWDDGYRLIHPTNAAAKFWLDGEVTVNLPGNISYSRKLDEHPIEQFTKGLELCTAGITPSEVLSKSWADTAPTFVVKNYLDAELYQTANKQDNSPNIILGWGGSLSHTESFRDSGVEEALQQILQERDNVYLAIIGDERVVKQLPVPMSKVKFMPYVPWWEWQKVLMWYDIGLAPLAGDYDDRRSSLKVEEYLLSGLPFVASKSPVYEPFWDVDSGRFVQHGHDLHTYNERVKDWYDSTIDVIDNLWHYRELAEKNIAIGEEYSIDNNVDTIINTYQQIIDLEREERL